MISFALKLLLITLLTRINGSLQATCDENEFKCTNEQCIDSYLVCDGEKNCEDGSDETRQVCSTINTVCQPFAFRCAYGACIDGTKKCNGKADCADNSDENHPDCTSTTLNNATPANNCPLGSFMCDSGQCINEYSVCDGEEHCRDGSDESETKCVNFPCPEIVGFQCAYGGCIDKEKKCNGVNDCKDGSDEEPKVCRPEFPLPGSGSSGSGGSSSSNFNCAIPDQPEGGSFIVANCEGDKISAKCRRVPGTLVESNSVIVYDCWKGFKLNTNYNRSVCIDSAWYPEPPICLKLCKPLLSNSLDISCSYKDSPVNCSQSMLPVTKAKLKCKQFFNLQGDPVGGDPICGFDGLWSETPFRCRPECGIKASPTVQPLVSHGTKTSAVEYPWHAALYKYDQKIGDIELFCGGSIISPYMVLTAAHCVAEGAKKTDPSEVKIAVGKTTRSWNVKDPGEQRYQVTKIFIHSDYQGAENRYAFDIAILELNQNIVVGSLSMPICIETIPPWTNIPNDTPGIVVGFGRNEENKLTETLMVAKLPYIDRFTCQRIASRLSTKSFRNYVTHDKFCGKYINGSGVQQGDSGGGLVFLKKENNLYFIRGIVSTKPRDLNSFATFTNISEKAHVDFIKEVKQELAPRHE